MTIDSGAWFVKIEAGIVSRDRFDAVVPAHLAWLEELEERGHQPRSGYWADRRGLDGAGGMLLFYACDLAAAEALVLTDPLIREGCVRWHLHEWRLVFGALAPVPRSETAAPDRT